MDTINNHVAEIGETCLVCEEKKTSGIHLFEHFICECCERKMVLTDTNDEYYHYYLKKLRKIKLPTSG
nr:sigma factor G inhibitor Gin [Bacillus sp. FJAT-45350]